MIDERKRMSLHLSAHCFVIGSGIEAVAVVEGKTRANWIETKQYIGLELTHMVNIQSSYSMIIQSLRDYYIIIF